MFIKVSQIANKYYFNADGFDSVKHGYLLSMPSFYDYAWEATRDARTVLKKAKTILRVVKAETDAQHVQVTGEDDSGSMAEELYHKTYRSIVERLDGLDESDKEEREMAYNEIKMIVQGLLAIKENKDDKVDDSFVNSMIKKFSDLTKANLMDLLRKDMEDGKIDEAEGDFQPPRPEEALASNEVPLQAKRYNWFSKQACGILPKKLKDFTFDEVKDIIEGFAISACSALQEQHPDITYMIYPESNIIDLVSCQEKKKYVKLSIGEDLLLNGILPEKELPMATSHKFYQFYWKPIVDKIGGIHLDDHNIILSSGLPDLPRKSDLEIPLDGFDLVHKAPKKIKIKFRSNPEDWDFCNCEELMERIANTSKYTEEDYTGDNGGGAIVRCTNPELKTIYGQTGVVLQVIPNEGFVMVDVDFGHHNQRMNEKDLEIVR